MWCSYSAVGVYIAVRTCDNDPTVPRLACGTHLKRHTSPALHVALCAHRSIPHDCVNVKTSQNRLLPLKKTAVVRDELLHRCTALHWVLKLRRTTLDAQQSDYTSTHVIAPCTMHHAHAHAQYALYTAAPFTLLTCGKLMLQPQHRFY